MKHFLLTPLALLISLQISAKSTPLVEHQEAEEVFEFSANALYQPAGQAITNLDRFRYANTVFAGNYLAEVFVNDKRKGTMLLHFADQADEQGNIRARLCVDPALVAILDLNAKAIAKKPKKNQCENASTIIPEGKFVFDNATQTLKVELPQELISQRPRGYISPSQWENGVPALYVQYHYNRHQTRINHQKHQYDYLGLRAGMMWEGWSIRHRGSYYQNSGKPQKYRTYATYLQKDIDFLEGRFTLGDFNTQGRVTGSLSLRGVSLASDNQMRPDSQRGFAPSVKGVATSNARVTIRQNGSIIYETTVPAGAFTIDDLYPSGQSGDLFVEINEDNGTSRSFIVPFSYSHNMMRQGRLGYEFAVGRYRQNNRVYPIDLFQSSLQYGLSNLVTTHLGITANPNYYKANLGTVWQLFGGGLETNFNLAHLKQRARSPSFSASYTRDFAQSGTYLHLSAEHFLAKRSYDLNDLVEREINGKLAARHADFRSIKTRYRLSLNQRLGEKWGSLYASGSLNHYYQKNQQPNRKLFYQYQFGYSNHIKGVEFQLGYTQGKNIYHQKESQIYLNLSMPFDLGKTSRHYLRTSYHKAKNRPDLKQVSLYGSAGQYHQFNYGTTLSKQGNYSAYAINAGYNTPYAVLSATHSRSKTTQQQSYQVNGAIVAHPYGISLSANLGETFGIIRAKGAKNARIKGDRRQKLDLFGHGIVPYLTPYRENHIGIDIEEIPENIEISATSKTVIPRANSANLVKFDTKSGYQILLNGKTEDNLLLPMGAEVLDQKNNLIGYVGQNGQIFARTAQLKGKMNVVLGQKGKANCIINYNVKPSKNGFIQGGSAICR